MASLQDKVCIITGGAGSVGLHSARAMLAEGARVLLVDRDPEALAAAAASIDSSQATRVATRAADVSSAPDTHDYIQAALRRWQRLDVLVCNAGVSGQIAPIPDYPTDDFDRVMAVNVKGVFLACKYGLPALADGGSVIITSSVVGVTADPGICAYATSKHALIGLMRVAAKEAAARRIRVNVIAPGPIDNAFQTDIEQHLGQVLQTDATALLNSKIPLGRHAHPDEIARMMVFLASDHSSFSTGSVFMADGGMHV